MLPPRYQEEDLKKIEIIRQRYLDWAGLTPEFKGVSDWATEADRSKGVFLEDLEEMGKILDISAPRNFRSHRPFFGPLIIKIKSSLTALAKPFIRTFLGRQIRFNYLVYMMAFRVANLENKVEALLEENTHLKKKLIES